MPQEFKRGHVPWNKGEKGVYSEEHLKRLSEIKLKNPVKYWLGKKRAEMVGDNNWKWKGNKVGYEALHAWVRRQLGSPNFCEHCKNPKKKWYHWANISKEYKRDVGDWLRLCVKCHSKFDKSHV